LWFISIQLSLITEAMMLKPSNFEQTAAEIAKIESEYGPIDVWVNNAGITRDGTMHRMSFELWDAVIQTNLAFCFNTWRAVIDGMRSEDSDCIDKF